MAIIEQLLSVNVVENDHLAGTSDCIQTLLMALGIKGRMITSIKKNGMLGFIQSIIFAQKEAKEPFYVLDLGLLNKLVDNWARALSMIQLYYAVKCNPETAFDAAAMAIKEAIDEHFSDEKGLIMMAEPWRFFAEKAFTLVTNIIDKRVRGDCREYWITDGIYGSMNCIVNNHGVVVTCAPLSTTSNPKDLTCQDVEVYESTIFGPTCTSFDTVLTGYQLPDLEVNDWLLFPNMGTYTSSSRSNFNGFIVCSISTNLANSNLI